MVQSSPTSRAGGTSAERRVNGLVLAFSVSLALSGVAQAQDMWRSLTVPKYPNAANYDVRQDDGEYDIYFQSQDDVQAVFDFYRSYLQQQGFRVTQSKPKSNGLKAQMVREHGGPGDTVELDAKLRRGQYKVEIEFDD